MENRTTVATRDGGTVGALMIARRDIAMRARIAGASYNFFPQADILRGHVYVR